MILLSHVIPAVIARREAPKVLDELDFLFYYCGLTELIASRNLFLETRSSTFTKYQVFPSL